MCENRRATVLDRWPAPVCADCDAWLVDLGADLQTMEAADPKLKEASERVERAWADLVADGPDA